MAGSDRLSFAYRYPFSSEAKAIVEEAKLGFEYRYLDMAKAHIESALNEGLKYSDIRVSSLKMDYLMAYLYSRMLVSAVGRSDIIINYSYAEARRSAQALALSDPAEIIHVAEELGVSLTDAPTEESGYLTIGFADFLKYSTRMKGMELSNQRLNHGAVLLFKNNAAKLLREAIKQQIKAGMPIPKKELPAEVIDYAKKTRLKVKESVKKASASSASHTWIDRLLETPIADVRHRTVNLILAPYLVNVKNMEVEEATKRIVDYIELCKQVEPTTRVNEPYIRYQCTYAKRKGSRPLSLSKAKELLGGALNVEMLEEAKK